MLEIPDEEQGPEGGEDSEAPMLLQAKRTAGATPVETKMPKHIAKTLAKKSVLGCKRSHPGTFIYLQSMLMTMQQLQPQCVI